LGHRCRAASAGVGCAAGANRGTRACKNNVKKGAGGGGKLFPFWGPCEKCSPPVWSSRAVAFGLLKIKQPSVAPSLSLYAIPLSFCHPVLNLNEARRRQLRAPKPGRCQSFGSAANVKDITVLFLVTVLRFSRAPISEDIGGLK